MGEPLARIAAWTALTAAAAAAFVWGPSLLGLDPHRLQTWRMAGWTLAPLSAAAWCIRAASRSQGEDRRAWRDFAAACFLWAAGTAAWRLDDGFPGLADGGYMLSGLFAASGMFRYGLQGRKVGLLQACDFAIAGFAVALVFLIALNDHLHESVLTPSGTVVAILYPVGWFSAAAFGGMCLLLYATRQRQAPLMLLVLAASTQATADLLYGLSLMEGQDEDRAGSHGLWIAAFVFFLWASSEHLRQLKGQGAEDGKVRRLHAEAFIPAAAVGMAGVTWSSTSFDEHGALVALPGAAAAAMAVFLGVREHIMLRNERVLRLETDESRRNLEAVLESTTDSVVVLDRDWRIAYRNNRANDLPGVAGLEPGTRLWDLFPGEVDGPFHVAYRKALATQKPVAVEAHLSSADRWIEAHAFPAHDKLTVFFRDVTERRMQREEVEFLALHDPLTGLANRHVFHVRLAEALAEGCSAAVICLDLDTFKEVNDTLGHPAGDELLVQVAERLGRCTGTGNTLARLGGDEFAIVVRDGKAEAERIAACIIEAQARPFEIAGVALDVQASMGVASAPGDAEDPHELFRRADIALYAAKSDGGGRFRCFEPGMETEILERQAMKAELAKAVHDSQMELAFQPIICLEDDKVARFEALVRWRHPERGMVPPDRFIPLSEETGAIAEIGEWVLNRACAAAKSWPARVGVSVNLSPCQFRGTDLPAMVSAALSSSGLPAGRLELEITENVLLHDSEHNLAMLHKLRSMGIAIALDDFGTGYSSLSYLRTFPFTRIKVDRSFVRGMDVDGEARSIVRLIVGLGRELGMQVTAEGVETRQELDCVRSLGCDAAQGFFIGRPAAEGQEMAAMAKVEADRIWRTGLPALRKG